MKRTTTTFIAVAALAACTAAFHAQAQTPAPPAVPVGVDTFVRAETDTYMGGCPRWPGSASCGTCAR